MFLSINLLALIVASRVLGFADAALNAGGSLSQGELDADGSNAEPSGTDATQDKAKDVATAPKARTRKAGPSGKRVNGATKGMPEVRRIEGKLQCRVVVVDRKGKILKAGQTEVSTPVRNSTPDKAAAIIGFQKRHFFRNNPTFSNLIEKAGDVRYVLQWLKGTSWVDHKQPAAKA